MTDSSWPCQAGDRALARVVDHAAGVPGRSPVTPGPGQGQHAGTAPGAGAVGRRRRAWLVYGLVVLPLLASVFATALLLVGLVLADLPGAALGGVVGPFVVAAWQVRPRRSVGGSPDAPLVRVLSLVAGVVAADLAAAVGVAVTGRLPAWALVLAVVLAVVHVGLLAFLVLRRERFRPDSEDSGRSTGQAGPLRWRDTPEPLRWLSGLVGVSTVAALSAFAVSEVTGARTQSAGVLWTGFTWGVSLVLLGACVASDVRRTAWVCAERSQAARGGDGPLGTAGHLPTLRRWMQAAGAVTAVAGAVIASVFWPLQ